jgi:hypothetical protein
MKKIILAFVLLGLGFNFSQASANTGKLESCKLLMSQIGESNEWTESKIPLSAPEEVLDFEVSYGEVTVGSAKVDISVYYHKNGRVSVQQILQLKDELSLPIGQKSLQFHLKPFEQDGKQYSHILINCL